MSEPTSVDQQVKILVFAGIREAVGASCVACQCDPPCTAASLKQTLAIQHPSIAKLVLSSRLAVDHTFVDDQATLELSDLLNKTLALIPPVSGG